MRRAGFTLIEMLLAITILSMLTVVVSVAFNSVTNSWKKATTVAERMQTADYALNQVVAGLRSAYYPPDGDQKDEWGFAHYDNGEGEDPSSSDMIEWIKLGNAIIGNKSVFAETTHRVRMWVAPENGKDEPGGLMVRVWNPDLRVEDDDTKFDEDEFGEEFLLVPDVIGFDCMMQNKSTDVETDGRPKWEEEWTTSNQIPYRVKITFRLKPPEKGDDPLPILRVVEIPVAPYSQNPFSVNSEGGGKDDKKKSSKDGKSGTGGNSGTGGKTGGNTGGRSGGGATGGRTGGGGAAGGMPGAGGGGAAGGGAM